MAGEYCTSAGCGQCGRCSAECDYCGRWGCPGDCNEALEASLETADEEYEEWRDHVKDEAKQHADI